MADHEPKLTERDFRQWKMIGDFRARLEQLAQPHTEHPSWQDAKRKLQQAITRMTALSLLRSGLQSCTQSLNQQLLTRLHQFSKAELDKASGRCQSRNRDAGTCQAQVPPS